MRDLDDAEVWMGLHRCAEALDDEAKCAYHSLVVEASSPWVERSWCSPGRSIHTSDGIAGATLISEGFARRVEGSSHAIALSLLFTCSNGHPCG